MKRILRSVTCIVFAAFCSAALLHGDEEAAGPSKQKTPYTYKFTKHEFNSASRTNFNLDVTLNRPDLVVTAWCDLRDDQQQPIGRFALANANAHDADAPVRFHIKCLAKPYIDKSTLRVEIREKKTNKHVGVLEVPLRDAVAEVVTTPVKER